LLIVRGSVSTATKCLSPYLSMSLQEQPESSVYDEIGVGIGSPEAAAFRTLADALGADREALIAQATSVHRGGVALDRISAPTLILAGEDDSLAVRPEVLADAIPNAVLQTLAGNHIEALGDPRFTRSIVGFLA
jgi:pimeloyl-ACP methyl ester carboxylesterase